MVAPGSTTRKDKVSFQRLVESARSSARVEGLTHNFYRYPARFAPEFARTAILSFSNPGDVVLDPFMGGGTTAVEAVALGRRFLGTDVNRISSFVTRVKTTPLTDRDITGILDWIDGELATRRRWTRVPMRKNLPEADRKLPWALREYLRSLLSDLSKLRERHQQDFVRCCLLRTSQWALDNQRRTLSAAEFRKTLRYQALQMLFATFRELPGHRDEGGGYPSVCRPLHRAVAGLESDRRVPHGWKPVRLVVTSPPYPGVHVLYHRWQLHGRKETSAPFWLLGDADGHGSSYFTMGPRYARDLGTYLAELESSFRSIALMLDQRSTVVQLIGFSDPETQLGPVLDVLSSVGLEEVNISGRPGFVRSWREVPNRRWYAEATNNSTAAREVVLVHRLSPP